MYENGIMRKFIAIVLVYSASMLFGGITKADANSIVLDTILADDIGKVNVYVTNEMLNSTSSVVLWSGEILTSNYESSWAYFVDDYPQGKWHHQCRIIFVDSFTGEYQIFSNTIFPVDYETGYELISEITKLTVPELPNDTDVQVEKALPNTHLYAVIINGSEHDEIRFWNDMSAMYCTLIDVYGFTKERIFVHYSGTRSHYLSGNPGSDDIDSKADKLSIKTTFKKLKEIMNPDDQLFVYIDGHGNRTNSTILRSYIDLKEETEYPDEDIFDYELAGLVEGINCAQMIFSIGCCYSGGFTVALNNYSSSTLCTNRSIHTASYNEVAWAEQWLSRDPVGVNRYHEFFFYWTAAARGYFPVFSMPWERSWDVDSFPFIEILSQNPMYIESGITHPGAINPDSNGDNYMQMGEVFNYVNNFDSWSEFGYCNKFDPNLRSEYPQNVYSSTFIEDLLTLSGISGNVFPSQIHDVISDNTDYVDTQTITGNFMVNSQLTIKYGLCLNYTGNYCMTFIPDLTKNPLFNGLKIENNAKFNIFNSNLFLENGTQITLLEGSVFEASGIAKITGNIFCDNASNIIVSDNSSLSIQSTDLIIHADTILKIGVGSSLIVENGSNLIFEDGAVIELAEDAEIRVMDGGRLVTNNNTSEKVIFKNNTGLWYSIVGEIGSTIEIADTEIIGAEFGVCGTPKICSITNSRFIDCDNGLSLIKLPDDTTENNSFTINNNYFYGKGIGTGITLTYCEDPIEGNSVYNFEEGVKLVSSSITLAKNKIVNNINNGLYVTGHGSKPVLVNALTKDAAPELRSFNNEIRDNCLNNPYYNGAQIYLSYSAGVYMTGGCNNVFSGGIGTIPTVPCIKGIINISPDPTINKVTIAAERNYWGYAAINSLNQGIFFDLPHTKPIDGEIETGYFIDYEPYGEIPFVEGGIYPTSDLSSNEPRSNESILLFNAMKLEQSDNLKPSIKLYEQIIKKYPDTPEYFVAITRLPELYIVDERSLEPLISSYDEALATENISVKKFFKEMKVSTHIKGKNYDTAIALAEEMMAEAEGEDEILLSEIDITIASMLKEEESGRKGRQNNYSDNLNKLLSKLNGTESKEEPAGLTENVMLPKESTLYQNYPNPFNPVTEIKFDLSKTTKIKLSVYNVYGQLVSELTNGVMNAGKHAIDFDGSRLNSGVYYYTLEVAGKSLTQKMILMK